MEFKVAALVPPFLPRRPAVPSGKQRYPSVAGVQVLPGTVTSHSFELAPQLTTTINLSSLPDFSNLF